MPQAKKVETVKALTEELKGKDLIFFDYEGITVEEITAIRRKTRELGSVIKIVKNTFLKLALSENGITLDEGNLTGMSAIAIIDSEFSASAKVLYDAEKEEKLKLKAGYFEGGVIDKDQVVKLASIPSKDVLYAMLVGSLQSPISNFVFTLQAIAEQKSESSDS